nr:hypothetical protein Itr_chr02CG12090 [Ipomoea trifida]
MTGEGKVAALLRPNAATKLLLGCPQLRYGRRTRLPCSASPMLELPGDAVRGNQGRRCWRSLLVRRCFDVNAHGLAGVVALPLRKELHREGEVRRGTEERVTREAEKIVTFLSFGC